MRKFGSWAPTAGGSAIFAVFLVANGAGPGVASAAPQANEQAYEAKFECSIPDASAQCSVTAGAAIPAGMRLRLDYVKARIVVPSRIKSPFEFSMDVGDPNASGGVRSIKVTPKQVGTTEGRFFTIWAVDEKVQDFAYRTDKCPAPTFRLNSPDPDPTKLLNGAVQDGVVGGALVGLD
jgi:hypothetical protein